MADLFLEWGDDLQLTPHGDLRLAEGDDLARQWIERRLFTAVYGYLWHLEYGAGIPQKIGTTYQPQQIEAIVRSQMLMEQGVSQTPPPRVKVTQDPNTLAAQVIRIDYTEAATRREVALALEI